MIIKDERQSTLILLAAKQHWLSFSRIHIALAFILVIFLIGLPNLTIIFDAESNQKIEHNQRKKEEAQIVISKNPEFGPIFLDIKQKGLQKLEFARNKALKKGYITEEEKNVEVPALLRQSAQEYPILLRLKGDLPDHIKGNQWSYRIKVKDGKFFNGVREFSIHHPKARNFLAEYLFNLANKQEDILTHRYDFIVVERNSAEPQLYAIEEHFTKQLIENAGRREGPILKFNENLWWKIRHNWDDVGSYKSPPGAGDYYSLEIDAFSLSKLKKNPAKHKQYTEAYSLLAGFREGRLNTSDVFVIDKMAKFLALSDLFGAYHGLAINQARFYFNPVLAKLEPIPFDANAGEKLQTPIGVEDKTIFHLINVRQLFKDKLFFRAYVSALNDVSKSEWLDKFKQRNHDELTKREILLQGFFPEYKSSWDQIVKNQKRIREFLEPLKLVLGRLNNLDNNQTSLQVANIHSLPVEILNIKINDKLVNLQKPLYLEQRQPDNIPQFQTIDLGEYFPNVISESSQIKLNIRIYGMESSQEETIKLEDVLIKNSVNPMRQADNLKRFSHLKIDTVNSVITIPKGTTILSETMIIPAMHKIIIEPGSTIILKNNANLISRSPIIARGTPDNPINFIGAARNKNQQGGIVVINTNNNYSEFDYVNFESLGAPKIEEQGWGLLGAINFYESNVRFKNSIFKDNRSGDDILNIIRSEFAISESLFKNSSADALDSDFSNGEIYNCEFRNTGNDAIDISGTKLRSQNIRMKNIGDKGISVGERSELNLDNLNINYTNIGITSKDGSHAIARNITISNAKIAFVALQKKPEYSPANLKISMANIENNVSEAYQIESGSSLILDGSVINGKTENLRADLY